MAYPSPCRFTTCFFSNHRHQEMDGRLAEIQMNAARDPKMRVASMSETWFRRFRYLQQTCSIHASLWNMMFRIFKYWNAKWCHFKIFVLVLPERDLCPDNSSSQHCLPSESSSMFFFRQAQRYDNMNLQLQELEMKQETFCSEFGKEILGIC